MRLCDRSRSPATVVGSMGMSVSSSRDPVSGSAESGSVSSRCRGACSLGDSELYARQLHNPTSSWSHSLVVPLTSSGLRGRGVVGRLTTTGVEDFGDQTSAQVKDKLIRGTLVRDVANVPALENQTIHGFIGANTDHIL